MRLVGVLLAFAAVSAGGYWLFRTGYSAFLAATHSSIMAQGMTLVCAVFLLLVGIWAVQKSA